MSIEEVKARLLHLAEHVPVDLLDQMNNRLMDTVAEMQALVAGTTNDGLVQAVAHLEAGRSLAVDGAMAIVQARDEISGEAERL